jgi:hypothetical protein
MAKQTTNLEIPRTAERSVDQARKAFGDFLTNTLGTIEQWGATDRAGTKNISKPIANAERKALQNLRANAQKASLSHSKALLKAKNLSEALRLHGEFIQRQMRGLAEQAKELGQVAARAAMGAAEAKTGTPHRQDADLEDALVAARERGRVRVADILNGEDMLSAEAFAQLLGTTRVTVNTKRQQRQVLALEGAKRGFRFPVWQVGPNGKPFAVIPDLFDRFGGDAWAVYRFLVQHHPELNGLTGREALRRGKSKEVVEVAESVARAFA